MNKQISSSEVKGLMNISEEDLSYIEAALKQLKAENEKLKTQYNCYACGNCKGKEDYINLEKHHKGLRKQFDELVKRNNTLSLRIEKLEKENEKLKQQLKQQQYKRELNYGQGYKMYATEKGVFADVDI